VSIQIFPSLLSADQTRLLDEVKALEAHCDGFHADIMDQHVAPNLALNYQAVNTLAKHTSTQMFVHLMIEQVEHAVNVLHLPANSIVSFHLRTTKEPQRIIKEITKKGWIASVAHEPNKDSLAELSSALAWVQHVLIMSVPLGFSGQEFLPESLTVLDEIYGIKKTQRLDLTIAMDGAITTKNIGMLASRGVEQFCIGSAIFGEFNRQQALEQLYEAAEVG
jgi:ribulose-phosphate 3-epimerase